MLRKDPTTNYKSKLVNIIREWRANKTISDNLYYRLYPTADCPPKFYGLPKIHKDGIPLRPIVSSIGNITYNIAKYLTQILSSLVGQSPHFIKNSMDFIKKIKDLEIPPGRKMVSYDVTALFTSIPVDQAIKVVEERLKKDTNLRKRCELSIGQLIQLVSFCLNSTYFTYNGTFYKQKHGTAMGSSVSPVIANLYILSTARAD